MTLRQAIAHFNAERANSIPEELKIRWLSVLDSSIHKELVLTHENPDSITFSPNAYTTTGNPTLIAPEPYSELYIHYLAMRSDLYYSDIGKYNLDLSLYARTYLDFEKYYNRTYTPIRRTEYFDV